MNTCIMLPTRCCLQTKKLGGASHYCLPRGPQNLSAALRTDVIFIVFLHILDSVIQYLFLENINPAMIGTSNIVTINITMLIFLILIPYKFFLLVYLFLTRLN